MKVMLANGEWHTFEFKDGPAVISNIACNNWIPIELIPFGKFIEGLGTDGETVFPVRRHAYKHCSWEDTSRADRDGDYDTVWPTHFMAYPSPPAKE